MWLCNNGEIMVVDNDVYRGDMRLVTGDGAYNSAGCLRKVVLKYQ